MGYVVSLSFSVELHIVVVQHDNDMTQNGIMDLDFWRRETLWSPDGVTSNI